MSGDQAYVIGKLIKNRYRVDQFVRENSIYREYSGYDLLLSRQVTIKFLRENLAGNREIRNHFLATAHRNARIRHSYLTEVYDFGMEDHDAFVIEEEVKGEPLSVKLQQGRRMSILGFLEFACKVTEALDALHRFGGVHGNLVPEKVMLLPEKNVKLVDSGYPFTRPGNGRIYLPLPREPFYEEDVRELGKLLFLTLNGEPLPASALEVELPTPVLDFKVEVPPKVKQILEKSLSRGERSRFDSAGEMLKELKVAYQREIPLSALAMERKEEVELPTKKFSLRDLSRTQKILGISIIGLCLLFLAIWLLASPLFKRSVEVPNLVGKNVEEVERELESRGLKLKVTRTERRADVQENRVVSQSPEGGKFLKEGSSVLVVVSAGPLKVPNVSGLPLSDATALIKARGLKVGEITYSFTSEYPDNVVIESVPPYGTEVSEKDEINLLVSRNP